MAALRDVKLFSLRLLRRKKRNPRTHSRKQIRQIANSIARFGWTYPILVDESNLILAGHGRYEAALQLGQHEVPVIIVSDLSDAKKRALALADNKVAANAGWDRKLLAEELGELAELLPECNLDLQITGFEAAEIDGLLGDLVDPERDPADEISSLKKQAVSKRGDLWELGFSQAPVRRRGVCPGCSSCYGRRTRKDGHRGPAVQLADQASSRTWQHQARKLHARLR